MNLPLPILIVLIPAVIILVTAYILHELFIITKKLLAAQIFSSNWPKAGIMILALVLAAVSGIMVYQGAFEAFSASVLYVPSQGTVKLTGLDFGVYWDITATQPVTTVNWGTLNPGGNKNVTFWVKNQAATPIYCKTLPDSTSWQPTNASNYLSLGWTFGTNSLGVSMLRRVNITLTVSPSIKNITDFSFTIIINAQDTPFS